MSKTRLVTIICTCISAITLTGLVIWFLVAQPWGGFVGGRGFMGFMGGMNIENLTGEFQPAGSYNILPENINTFDIDWVAGNVTIKPHDGADIVVTEYAQRNLAQNERFEVNVSDDGTIAVNFVEGRGGTFRRMPPKRLEVLLPASIAQNLTALTVVTVSADVNISDISAQELNTSSVSGRQGVSNITTETFTAGTTSGRKEISNVTAETFRAGSVSGRITLESVVSDSVTVGSTSGALALTNIRTGFLDTGTVSGTQDISGALVHVDSNSTSGRVSVQSSIVPESLNISTVSGRVEVTVPDDGNPISVSHSSVSGRFSSQLPVLMHGADAQFRISTTSGNINIYELR